MRLTELSCSRGAPMGRRDHHAHGMDDLEFELEHVPFTDGGYDAGGAYWGAPATLYCAVAAINDEELARHFIRADSRAGAMAKVREDYPDATFQPENGSLIEQMIEHLQSFLDRCHERGEHEFDADTEAEIAALEDELDIINHRKEHGL